jgi:hypothetical protein
MAEARTLLMRWAEADEDPASDSGVSRRGLHAPKAMPEKSSIPANS